MPDHDYLREDERELAAKLEDGNWVSRGEMGMILNRLADARRVLATLEWSVWDEINSVFHCPCCDAVKYKTRHDVDCAIAAALEGVNR